MTDFIPYIRQKLEPNGYRVITSAPTDLILKTDDNKPVWVCYLTSAITPEDIRRSLNFPGHVLFVIDEKLMPDEIESREATPMWLRVLHGLYMGRIYTWNGRALYGLHFDYDTGDVSESPTIQPDSLLLIETGTWLRGWTDTYRLARFWDKAWWAEDMYSSADDWHHRQQQRTDTGDHDYSSAPGADWYRKTHERVDPRQAYEQARDNYWRQQQTREQQSPPRQPPPPHQNAGRDYLREFLACGNKAAARQLFRTLAKEFHPDLNPGKDTTVEMQQINLAWERAERML